MRITRELLKSKQACNSQVELFAKLFPKGVTLTKAVCVKHAQAFDWDWAARHLLNEKQQAEYKKVKGPALAEYLKVEGLAWAEHEKVNGRALVECNKQYAIAFWKAENNS